MSYGEDHSYIITMPSIYVNLINALVDVINSEWKEISKKKLHITITQDDGNTVLLLKSGSYRFSYLKKRISKKMKGVRIVGSINLIGNKEILGVIHRQMFDGKIMDIRNYKSYIIKVK